MRMRFGVLDALRGIGALTVVLYHGPLMPTPSGDVHPARFGYLAVDLFFLLSGFVIAFSYESRLALGMTVRQFMKARIVRLYPIFFICTILGCLPALSNAVQGLSSRGDFIGTLILNLMFFPSISGLREGAIYPNDFPSWSLFFELIIANLGYALIRRKLSDAVLIWIIGASLAALILIAVCTGTIDVGSDAATFGFGTARVLFSFYAGVAIFRLWKRRPPPPVAGWLLLVVVATTFMLPIDGHGAVAYELFCVVVVYPSIIYLGTSASERYPAIGSLLGDLSYAIYLLHIPLKQTLVIVATSFGIVRHVGAVSLMLTLIIGFVLARYYDPLARAWLARTLERRVPA